MKKKAHIRYKLTDNTRVPGVTTVIGQTLGWNKRVLMNWANKMGLEGIDSNKYTDEKARIGTLVHQMILDYFRETETDTSDYSRNEIEQAKNSMLSFFEWKRTHELTPNIIEQALVSDEYRYGGTPDYIGGVNGILELIDFKSGSGIYDEHIIQVSAYWHLSECEPTNTRILQFPRSKGESFRERLVGKKELDIAWKIFKKCLEIHWLKKEWSNK